MTLSSRDRALLDPSPDVLMACRLVEKLGREGAHRAIDALVSQFSNVELAAIASEWALWARPKQIAPAWDWVTWGDLTARGWGKTKAKAQHLVGEIEAGRARRIGLAAQNEAKAKEAQVSALIAASPPWFSPEWRATDLQLVWPNGATALVFTPEVPGAIRSENFDLVWLSELQSWPLSTREEAYSNFVFATRVGYARTVWDSTPKRGHPILRRLLAAAEAEPAKHVVVRGTIYENPHLARSAIEKMEREYAGTQKGREELLGEMLPESENAMVKQEWIDRARRAMPDAIARRVISVDPAITTRAGSDRTAILDIGLGVDGQMLVLGDRTDKHKPEAWAAIVLDLHARGGCDLVVVETNRGGDLVTSNLRMAAPARGLTVTVIDKDATPRRVPGTVYVKEVHSRGSKEERATPLATAYERQRVSHVIGVDLSDLEDTLTTWEPQAGQRSPDRLDALSQAAVELLGLLDNRTDAKAGFVGITAAAKVLAAPTRGPSNLAALLSGGTGGRI